MSYSVYTNGNAKGVQTAQATKQIQNARLSICNNICKMVKGGKCALCGCDIKEKVKDLNSRCPKNEW
jgi:hypothetical protein